MSNALVNALTASAQARLQRWWRTHAQRAELQGLPDTERERVLREIGLTKNDINHLVADHPGPERLLPAWLAIARVDIGYVRATQPAVLRDLQHVCSRCRDWKRCEAGLDRGEVYDTHCAYCLNAGTIDALIVGCSTCRSG